MAGLASKRPDCDPQCPIWEFCDRQQEAYEIALGTLVGTDSTPGIANIVMEAGEEVVQSGADAIPGVTERLDVARTAAASLFATVEGFRPPDLDYAAMEAACGGAIDNFGGLAHGFDATRRCGSTAIDEALRRGYTKIIERAPADPQE